MRARRLKLAFAFACAATTALAQSATGPNPETIQIGLSTDTIAITAGFEGKELTVFGALNNTDPLIQRQGRYDIVVVLEGPAKDIVVRKKARLLGIWVNRASESFSGIPSSYSLASTRSMQDITDSATFAKLSLGVTGMVLNPTFGQQRATLDAFIGALKAIKLDRGLYNERPGAVEFISPNLFRATLALSADVPVGNHLARAFLFRNGAFLKESSTSLQIVKAGFEQQIYRAAHDRSFYYGMFSVALAMLIGWLGRVMFKRD